MKTTKKDFINTLCTTESVLIGPVPEIEESAIMAVLKATWHPYDEVRTVTKRASNHLVFSNGSRLYFDSFAKRNYERWDCGDEICLAIHITEKGMLPEQTKHLYYMCKQPKKARYAIKEYVK